MPQLIGTTHLFSDGQKSPLAFERRNDGALPLWNRVLTMHGTDAICVGNVCDTCGFFFENLAGPNSKLGVRELRMELEQGAQDLDRTMLETLAQLMPRSTYTVAAIKIRPKLVAPRQHGDYFANDDFEFADSFPVFEYGPPHPLDPKTPYFRIEGRSGVHIEDAIYTSSAFDFVIPIQSYANLEQARVEYFKETLIAGATPSVVALSLLDVKGPSETDCVHWVLAHYLLDGHHKLAAAAQTKSEVMLIAFIAHEHGVSESDDISRFLNTYPS